MYYVCDHYGFENDPFDPRRAVRCRRVLVVQARCAASLAGDALDRVRTPLHWRTRTPSQAYLSDEVLRTPDVTVIDDGKGSITPGVDTSPGEVLVIRPDGLLLGWSWSPHALDDAGELAAHILPGGASGRRKKIPVPFG